MRLSVHLRYSLLLASTLFFAGCGGGLGLGIDGGPVGTGISASVVGNIVAVEEPDAFASTEDLASTSSIDDATSLEDLASIDGIDVSLVEFPDVATTTNAEGNFGLDGDFDGAVTLRFRTPEFEIEQSIEVPSGGVVVLSDIELDRDGVNAEAGRQLGLVGRVREIDCTAGQIRLEDRRDTRFTIELLDDTEFSRRGEAFSCLDIRRDDTISVEGLSDDIGGRSVTALVIEVDPDDSQPRPVERQVAFLGNIAAVECAARLVAIHDGDHLIRVRLAPDIQIRTAQDRRLDCEDLALGDRVTGGGLLDLTRPGLVHGNVLIVGGRLGPRAELRIRGIVAAADCEESVLQVAFQQGAIAAVRILPETIIRAPDNFSCERLPGQFSVEGTGVVSADLPGGLDAVELKFRRVKRN